MTELNDEVDVTRLPAPEGPAPGAPTPRAYPAWESEPREPLADDAPPEDLSDVVLARLKEEINEASFRQESLALWANSIADTSMRNDRALNELMQQGMKLDPPLPVVALTLRLQMLCTVLLGDIGGDSVTADRLRYEERVQAEFSKMVETMRSQLSRAKLTTNIQMPPNGGGLPRG